MAKKDSTKSIDSVSDLFNFLYEACNILRGPIGQDSFKEYVTPILYFKRISDVWDEETEQALAESGGDVEYASLPELHRFVIPEGCHWQDLRERTENLGSAIVESMRMIERANPTTLYGVLSTFSKAQWTDKTVLTDSRLKDLIEHMSKVKLGNANYPADLMGDAYEILLKKFADLSKAKAGEFYTPRAIVKLLVRILDPKPGESIYDPACGSGGMLIEAAHYMHYSTLCCGRLYGQEKNVTNAAIAKMNLFLHGAADFNIMQGDTLRDPKIVQNGKLAQFDNVLANPPFSLDKWGLICGSLTNSAAMHGEATSFKWRLCLGAAYDCIYETRHRAHRCCSAPGVLFRGQEEYELRKQLVKTDKLECVITLVNNLFYGAGIPACLMILETANQRRRLAKVLMIDASSIFTAKRAQNELSPENVDQIYKLYADYADVEETAKVVTLREIEEKDYILSVNRYIERKAAEVKPYEEVKAEFKQSYENMVAAEAKFRELLTAGGYQL